MLFVIFLFVKNDIDYAIVEDISWTLKHSTKSQCGIRHVDLKHSIRFNLYWDLSSLFHVILELSFHRFLTHWSFSLLIELQQLKLLVAKCVVTGYRLNIFNSLTAISVDGDSKHMYFCWRCRFVKSWRLCVTSCQRCWMIYSDAVNSQTWMYSSSCTMIWRRRFVVWLFSFATPRVLLSNSWSLLPLPTTTCLQLSFPKLWRSLWNILKRFCTGSGCIDVHWMYVDLHWMYIRST